MDQKSLKQPDNMRTAALTATINSALQYGDEGLKLAVQILTTETGQTRLFIYDLLWQKLDDPGRKKLRQYLLEIEKQQSTLLRIG